MTESIDPTIRERIENGETPWWICSSCGAPGVGGTESWPKKMFCDQCHGGMFQRANRGVAIPIGEERL